MVLEIRSSGGFGSTSDVDLDDGCRKTDRKSIVFTSGGVFFGESSVTGTIDFAAQAIPSVRPMLGCVQRCPATK